MDESLPVPERGVVERAFLFADLCGFTAATETHGDSSAATMAHRFSVMAESALAAGSEIVKMIGDAAMIVAPNSQVAVVTAVALARAVAAEPLLPLVRMGIHQGACVERDGDYFGSTVNLAARVGAHARPGRILVTEAVATQLCADAEWDLVDAGVARFKKLSKPSRLFDVVRNDREVADHRSRLSDARLRGGRPGPDRRRRPHLLFLQP